MQKLIITGADQVVGANLAAVLGAKFSVTAVSENGSTIGGCHNETCSLTETLRVQELISSCQPDVLIHCGPFAGSSWSEPEAANEKRVVANLCSAVRKFDCRIVFVSTDAGYSGPWLFHPEDSDCRAATKVARQLQSCEELVNEVEGSLILRTHVIGWAPDGSGLLEFMLDQLEEGTEFGFGHYATPVAATRFAEFVGAAIDGDLSGTFNVGGAERTSPYGFGSALSRAFDLEPPVAADSDTHNETSMRSSAIRDALDIALPTVGETVDELVIEFDERIAVFEGSQALARVA